MHDPNEIYEPAEASKCLCFLRLLWKFFRCIFSHVTLVSMVVAYCILGAWAFKELEAGHEKEVKRSIEFVRLNVTQLLWKLTEESAVLIQENWTSEVVKKLVNFETELMRKMKKDGWDGNEDTNNLQWTFAGALFYSIIVITTIGYGHIAPKTQNGKIVTIFYAILGIPLMLLCLSNIGDVMASSFRFLYWKICCYVCTRPPKPPRSRHSLARSQSVRQSGRYASSGRSTATAGSSSFRRSMRASQRSAESVLPVFPEVIARSAHSDTDCSRCRNCSIEPNAATSGTNVPGGSYSLKETSPRYLSSTSPASVASPRFLTVGTKFPPSTGSRSLDRKALPVSNDVAGAPVLFNKYAVDEPDVNFHTIKEDRCELEMIDDRVATKTWPVPRRCRSVEAPGRQDRNSQHTETARPTRISSVPVKKWRNSSRPYRREASSARIMSPMGFAVHRQIYVDDVELDYDYLTSVELQSGETTTKPVPIWLCVFLVVSYIFGGAFLFTKWEEWDFLDSAYFCFITLTTIGFGDLVPAHQSITGNAEQGIALCSLYLLFGIALLAMSFNLVQEEVINNVKNVAKRLGILKEDDGENNDEEDYDLDEDNDNYLLDREEGRYYNEYERSAYTSAIPEIDRFNDRQYRLKPPSGI